MEDFVTKSAKATSLPTVGNVGAGGVVNSSGEAVTKSKNTKLVAKKSGKAADPTIQNAAKRGAAKAKTGYGIKTTMPAHTCPAAGATQANGRLFKAAVNRTGFNDGMASSY